MWEGKQGHMRVPEDIGGYLDTQRISVDICGLCTMSQKDVFGVKVYLDM